jgi:hypothetical protein
MTVWQFPNSFYHPLQQCQFHIHSCFYSRRTASFDLHNSNDIHAVVANNKMSWFVLPSVNYETRDKFKEPMLAEVLPQTDTTIQNIPCHSQKPTIRVIIGSRTAVAQWLRYCATNQKFDGSIPDGVTGIFHWHTSFWSHYGLEVDSAEMSTGSIFWG